MNKMPSLMNQAASDLETSVILAKYGIDGAP